MRPSVATIEVIGQALKLSSDECVHIRGPARVESILTSTGAGVAGRSIAKAVPDVSRYTVTGMTLPVHVHGYRTELLRWNKTTS